MTLWFNCSGVYSGVMSFSRCRYFIDCCLYTAYDFHFFVWNVIYYSTVSACFASENVGNRVLSNLLRRHDILVKCPNCKSFLIKTSRFVFLLSPTLLIYKLCNISPDVPEKFSVVIYLLSQNGNPLIAHRWFENGMVLLKFFLFKILIINATILKEFDWKKPNQNYTNLRWWWWWSRITFRELSYLWFIDHRFFVRFLFDVVWVGLKSRCNSVEQNLFDHKLVMLGIMRWIITKN